jgi:hypothetical protein
MLGIEENRKTKISVDRGKMVGGNAGETVSGEGTMRGNSTT